MIEVYLMVPLLYAGTRMKEGKGLYYLLVLFGLFGILNHSYSFCVSESFDTGAAQNQAAQFGFLFRVFSAGLFSGASLEEKKFPKPVAAAPDTAGHPARTDGCHSERTARRYFLWVFLPSGLSGGNMPVFTVFLKNIGAEKSSRGEVVRERLPLFQKPPLGIYLLHPFVLERLDRAGINNLTWNTWCAVPLVTL